MGLARGSFLPQLKVQELAEREGAKAYVVGTIARVGGSYQISARVVATNGGAEPLTAHATARDSTALIGAVEEVGHTLRRGIGESLRSVLGAPALAQVTTASLPALRAYSASRRAEVQGQRPRAVVLAKEALSLDTTFAAAWAGLHVTYTNMGFVRLATEAAQRAYALRDHLSDVERLRVEADYHATRGENVEEEAAWQRLAELGLDQIGYSNMLLGQGRLREAEAMARRAVAAEPKHPIGYWNLAEAQLGQQHFAAADSTAALIATNLPENGYRYFIPVNIRWGRRDLDAVESYLRSPEGARLPNVGPRNQCLVDLRRGRIGAWQRCPVHDGVVDGNPQLIMAEFRMTGDSVRARAGYEKFLTTARDDRDPDQYPAVIALLADVGRVRDARALLDEWRARAGAGDLGFRADSAQAVGAIAAAEGKWDSAVAAFLAWNGSIAASSRHIYNRGLPEAAAILARRGQSDSAVVLFERALATSSLYGAEIYEASWYAQALSMLGDLHDARGDRAKAAEYYRRYVELLKDADPPIAAQVAAVRTKLARVAGGS
jgi:tetratricopeptide (TPR) repeat protein